MGHILSSDTVYAVAYLTDKGRQYLFDPINYQRFKTTSSGANIDAFKIAYFSMSDPDYNYNVLSSLITFETGDISNISGKNDDCIKGTIMKEEYNLISANGGIEGTITDTNTVINTTQDVLWLETDAQTNNVITLNISTLPII